MIKQTLFAVAAAAISFSAVPAFAKDVTVSYADLNLATADGQQALGHRIDRAAKKACEFHSTRNLSVDAASCVKQAKAKARTEMAAVTEDARLGG